MKKKLVIYNTLSGSKKDFIPIDKNNVRVYACGPTVYNYAHIGNGRMAVVCDLLINILRKIFKKVTFVSNITDIDDKIITAAKENRESVKKITERFTRIYNEDMNSLGVNKPNVQPKATENIPEMIKLIEELIRNGSAYVKSKHVLFHVPSYPYYGKLSKRSQEEQILGSRVEVAPFKKYAGDFVLWKPSKPDEPYWQSPWGNGRPGWHLECSAMSEKTLGLPFDIHAGGVDLTFPHHENEIAQSCSIQNNSTPEAFAKYWFHNGFVMSDGEKMSKSIGNIIHINELVKKFSGETIRLAILSSHYRQPLNWTDKILHQSKKTLDKFYRILQNLESIQINSNIDKLTSEFMDILLDDINTPKAIAFLSSKSKNLKLKKEIEKQEIKKLFIFAGKILGLFKLKPSVWFRNNHSGKFTNVVEKLIQERNKARLEKDFIKSDEIRERLKKMGIQIEDGKKDTFWRKN